MRYMYYVAFFFLMLSCKPQSSDDKSAEKNEFTEKITLIFENIPTYSSKISISYRFTVENTEPLISYWDGVYRHSFSPKTNDTITLSPKNGYIYLTHRFNTISKMDYIISKGDIVHFTYSNNTPHVSIENKKSDLANFDYEQIARNRVPQISGYTPIEIYSNPYFTNDSIDPDMIINYYQKIKNYNYLIAIQNYKDEKILLDSLQYAKKISQSAYFFYLTRATFRSEKLMVEQQTNPELGIIPIQIDSSNEKYINPFYFEYLESYIAMKIENATKPIKVSNGQIANYKIVFDKIVELRGLHPCYKDVLLSKYLSLIGNSFSKSDFELYFNKAKKIIIDTSVISIYNEKYITMYSPNTKPNSSLIIENSQGDTTTLAGLISANHDKLIYIDFWASWCIPCRVAMPSSKKLRDTYKNANVLFVYISIDKDKLAWEKANIAENLSNYLHSYIATNQDNNIFLKSLDLDAIPRYLLYGRKGILVNPNAPNPQNAEIIELLDRQIFTK